MPPNTCPKVLSSGRGRGRGNFPIANWASSAKGCGCGINNRCDIPKTPPVQQEPERNLAVVTPTDRIQTYKGDLALARTRRPLANWTWVSLDNTWGRLIIIIQKIDQDEDIKTMITEYQLTQKVHKEMQYILMKTAQLHQDQV